MSRRLTVISERLDGRVIAPGDDGYNRARTVFHGGIEGSGISEP